MSIEKKYVVVSTNLVDDYLFYLPLVCYCWNKLGWGVLILLSERNDKTEFVLRSCISAGFTNLLCFDIPKIEGYKSETLTQCSRMYIANNLQDDVYVMVSDCDIVPLTDYWQPEFNDTTCYGRNLSDEHQPMCYVGLRGANWKQLMSLTGNSHNDMKRDLDSQNEIKWTTDQDILTFRLWGKHIKGIDRPIDATTGYPVGRIDRSSWEKSLLQKERIDAHLFRKGYEDENWNKILTLVVECFQPTFDELMKLNNYRNEYVKLL